MRDEPVEIFAPRYDGRRFSEHRLPLDLVNDLAVLQQMTVQMAKHLYLEDNEDRKRTPRGFLDGISMELDELGEGSTIPKILLVLSLSVPSAFNNSAYFKRASETIVELIQAAENGENLDGLVPKSVLSMFARFGNNLKNDECIEFKPDNAERKAKYDKAVQNRLVTAASQSNDVVTQIRLRGYVTALNKRNLTFEFLKIDGRKVSGNFKPQELEQLQEGLVKYERRQKVSLSVVARFRDGSKTPIIEGLESVELLDEFDVPARLEELVQLKGGWLDDESEGEPLPVDEVSWLTETFENYYPQDTPLPATFPTVEGNVLFEWNLNNANISLEVNLVEHSGEYFEYDKTSKESRELVFDLNSQKSWLKVSEHILSRG
jgi:hypothetical protein